MNANSARVKWYRLTYWGHRLAWPVRWWTLCFAALAVVQFFAFRSVIFGFPGSASVAHAAVAPVSQKIFWILITWVVVFGSLTLLSAWFNVWLRYLIWWVVNYWPAAVAVVIAASLIIWRQPLVPWFRSSLLLLFRQGNFLKIAAAAILAWLVYGVYRARGRLVILPFANYTGEDALKCCVEGMAPLLLNELGRIAKLYNAVDDASLTEVSTRSLTGALRATVSVEDVGDVLQSTVSSQSQVKFWGIEIPVGAILRVFGRLARGPRLSGSLHQEGKRLILVVNIDAGRQRATTWRISPEDIPDAATISDAELVGLMVDQLAYRVFTDLVPTISQRWQAVHCYAQGLRFVQITTRTRKDKEANLRQAEKAFLQALSEDNKFARSHYNLGVVYTTLRQSDAAQAAFCAALKEDPKLTQAYYALANDSWDRKDYRSTVGYCDQVIALQPSVAPAWNLRALSERRLQEERKLQEERELQVGQNPPEEESEKPVEKIFKAGEYPEAWRRSLPSREIGAALAWKALCRVRLTDRKNVNHFREVASKCARDVAVAHSMLLNLRGGISIMEQALHLSPADADLYFELGKILVDPATRPSRLSRLVLSLTPGQAIKHRHMTLSLGLDHFRTATQIEPRRGLYWAYFAQSLGSLFEKTRKEEHRQDVRAACEHALDVPSGKDKEALDARDKVQAALKAIGDLEKATKVLQITQLLRDLEPGGGDQTNDVYLARLTALEQTMRGQKGEMDTWSHGLVAGRLAFELLQQKEFPRARELADAAIKSLSPRHFGEVREQGLYSILALAYLDQEKPEMLRQALLYAQRGVAMNPERAWERNHLASVYWALGQYTNAEMEWKACLDLSPEQHGFWARIASTHWQRGVFLRDVSERKKAFRSVIDVYAQAIRIMESMDLKDAELDAQIIDRGSVHYWTGRFHLELLEYDQAVAHLQIARNMAYMPLESIVCLGQTHTEARNYDDAERSFREAVRRVRDQRKQGKQYKESDSGLGEETPLNELLIENYLLWSFSYSDRRTNLRRAEQLARKAARLIRTLDPSKALQYESTYFDYLAYAKLRTGRVQEAIADFQQSLALGTGAGCCFRLAEAYSELAVTDATLRNSYISKALEYCERARDADLREKYSSRIQSLKARLTDLTK